MTCVFCQFDLTKYFEQLGNSHIDKASHHTRIHTHACMHTHITIWENIFSFVSPKKQVASYNPETIGIGLLDNATYQMTKL